MIPGLLIRIPFGGGGILLSDIVIPAFAGMWVFKKLFLDQFVKFSKFLLPGFMFGVVALLSWIWGAWDLEFKAQVLSFSYIVRFISILVLAWAASEMVQKKAEIEPFFYKIFAIVGIIILTGYIQFFVYPDISKFSTVGGFDPHTGRLLGTWMDPNFVAGLLGFFLPLMCAVWYETKSQKNKIILGGFIVCCLYALFLTFSRSGYLAAMGGLGLFFLFRDPKIILVGIIVATLGLASNERAQKRVGQLAGTLAAVLFQETDEVDATAKLRVESWSKSLTLFEKYPVLGIGYNTYRYRAAEEGIVDETYFSAGGSDSTLLTVLVTTGIIGFLVFMWFYWSLWIRHFLIYWSTKHSLHLGFVAGWSAILVHSVFVNSLLFPLIFMPILVVLAVLESTSSLKEE